MKATSRPAPSEVGAPSTGRNAVMDTSNFSLPAYKERHAMSSLGPQHSVVVLTTSSDETDQPISQLSAVTGPSSMQPKLQVGKEQLDYPPKPLDRRKINRALHINPKTKFKVTKLKQKDPHSPPLEELS